MPNVLQMPNIEPLPEVLATNFVRDQESFGEDAEVVHDGDKTKILRVFQREELLPNIGQVSLILDYRKYHKENEKRPHRLQFEYLQANQDSSKGNRIIAQMQLQCVADGTFILDHRHVLPEFRGTSGIGKRLYEQAEHFIQQIANEKGADVTMGLQVGQQSVIVWAKKRGFSVIPEHEELFDELHDHPERFIEDDVFVSPESQAQGIVKERYTFRSDVAGRYMEDAIRITMKKVIHSKKQP